jgi:ubiquinone/menaquinone biosynthesis C-methylase UbiE
MAFVDVAADAPDLITYLDAAASIDAAREYKRWLLDALDVRAGQVALDVGCGPGTDLLSLAAAVGAEGSVVGVDADPVMVREARRRTAGAPRVAVRRGDAHALALPAASVDRARVDRVLQHLRDPAAALVELRRVLRPGGLLGLAEPDWDTLAIDDPDLATCRTFTRFMSDNVHNGAIGRQLPRLAVDAGFTVRTVRPMVVLLHGFEAAEELLGLRRNAARAVRAGRITEATAAAWLARLAGAAYPASFIFTTAVVAAP